MVLIYFTQTSLSLSLFTAASAKLHKIQPFELQITPPSPAFPPKYKMNEYPNQNSHQNKWKREQLRVYAL